MWVNLINSFYTSVFLKKQMLKKLTHWKKKKKKKEEFHVNSAIRTVHMLHCSMNSVSCYTVWTV